MKNFKKDNKGFTIIEVLIVLAIAGLIMLVVFLAVPALQRNSRNTQRKSDVSAILGSITEYTSNNAGALPATGTGQFTAVFASSAPKLGFYDGATLTNVTYNYSAATRGAAPTVPVITGNDVVNVYNNLKCVGNAPTIAGASARSIAALYNIEGSAANVLQCQET